MRSAKSIKDTMKNEKPKKAKKKRDTDPTEEDYADNENMPESS